MMRLEPRVSVVVIFLNAAPFLREAIDSVLAQSHDSWELLLVDDGSTDDSSEIARDYVERNPRRMRYLTHPGRQNRGMSASRNRGIGEARGEYVAFLDADDVWLPEKLEEQVAILDSQPQAAMVYGPAEWWFSWTGKPDDAARDFVHQLGVPADQLIEPPVLLIGFLADEGISPCTCSVLVRRAILDRVGGFEESFRSLYEDQVLSAKVCLEYPVYAAGVCRYRYRQHDASALAVAGEPGRQAARVKFLDWLSQYVTDRGVDNVLLAQTLSRERRRARHPRLDAVLRHAGSLRDFARSARGKGREGIAR